MGLIDWIKLITPLGWAIIVMSVLAGIGLGYFLNKRFPNLFSQDKKINEVINNPHLLVEKLKAQGKVYDYYEDGQRKELNFRVGLNDKGKEVVVIEALPRKSLKEAKKKLHKELKKSLKKKKTTKKGGRKK